MNDQPSTSTTAIAGPQLAGTVVRVTFRNPDNGYTVARLEPEDPAAIPPGNLQPDGLITLVGAMPGIETGAPVQVGGQWVRDPKFGRQFRVAWFKPSLPTGVRGIRAYLASGAVKGIGPVTADRIVEAFGERAFEILENDPEQLKSVAGIRGKTLLKIVDGWRTARGDRELITFLGEYGIAPGVAARLRKVYAERALSIVRANPYRLTGEVRGIGFRRADEIAQKIGLAADSPERIDAALDYVLQRQSEEGHTCLPREKAIDVTGELLAVGRDLIEQRLETALAGARMKIESIDGQAMIFIPTLHDAEQRAAYRLRALARAPRRLPRTNPVATIADFEQRARIALAQAQRQAVLTFAREGLMILTGGPGTGKTTTVRAIIDLFLTARCRVKLAAPTGRAARRLAETAKLPADTIHRLLQYQPHTNDFARNATNPIEAELVIVDETSMLDAPLAASLLEAVAPGTCLLLIGDEDQLPSVGPGNVLGDVIAAGALPVVRLTEVFRQAGESLIVTNAHRINRGEMPVLNPEAVAEIEPDFFFIERDDPPAVIETIKALIGERIPKKFRLDPLRDVQVLTPMRRGELGVDAINAAIKGLLNPDPAAGAPPAFFNRNGQDAGELNGIDDAPDPRRRVFTARDRVMQISNNYEKGVSNGDIGHVEHVNIETRELVVRFEGRSVNYLGDELDQLVLAYATTIHKSQGSEYPAVIIPVHTQHWIMLQRNLIYTALTRARRLVCLVGTKKALRRAVANAHRAGRFTGLRYFLERQSG